MRQNGLSDLYSATDEDGWIFDAAEWPLQFAIFWIALRDKERVAKQFAAFRFWKGHVWRNPEQEGQLLSLNRAQFDLWQRAVEGEVTISVEVVEEIYHNRYRRRIDVERTALADTIWKDDARDTLICNGRDAFKPRVARQQLLGIWAVDGSPPRTQPARGTQDFSEASIKEASDHAKGEIRNRSGSKVGRKPKPETDQFWIEVCGQLVNGKVDSLRTLTNHMNQWATKNESSFDPDTIRKKTALLFHELGWTDGAIRD